MDSSSIRNFTLAKRKSNTGQHSNDREKSENQILLLIIIKKNPLLKKKKKKLSEITFNIFILG